MHDFGKIAYLDMHKTGSSYVSRFLRACCALEEVRFRKHDCVRNDYNPECFYFTSIREPIGLYSSLYRYGLEEKGGVFHSLKHHNLLSCYESFNSFTSLLLDSDAAPCVAPGYTTEIAQQIGFMSFRFVTLSLQFPGPQITNAMKQGQEIRSLEKNFITSFEMKTENLTDDLKSLSLVIFPQYFNENKVGRFFDENEASNKSAIPHESIDALSNELKDKVAKKEDLLLSRYRQA